MVWQERHRSWAIAAFSGALACLAALLLAGPLRGVDAPLVGLPWWVLLPAFTAAELVVVHVQVRRESLTVSFAELPLVLGLAFAAPLDLVVASVLGSAIGLLHRRQTGLKLAFNLALFAFEAALALTLYHLALGAADPASARGLVAALATVVVTDLVSAAAVTAVVRLKVGEWDGGVVAEAVSTGLVAALTNTSVGLLVVVLLASRPLALPLLAVVLGTLVVAYRGYSSLIRGHARLESLHGFTKRLGREVLTTSVAEAALREARDVLAAATAELVLLATEGDPGTHLVLSGERLERLPVRLDDWWAPTREGIAVRVQEDESLPGSRHGLAAPMEAEGQVVGALIVHGRAHHLGSFGEDDLRLLESLANHAAVSLQKARLVDELRQEAATNEHLSLHDVLTGLPNRRNGLRALAEELASSPTTAVLVLDLDGFTDINDALGHVTGDEVLREVGRRLLACAQEAHHVSRLGNDEFAVILPVGEGRQSARSSAEAVLAALTAPFPVDGVTVDVRACAGLAMSPGPCTDAELLLQRAQAAMYSAKRDRVGLRVWDTDDEGGRARRLALLGPLRDAVVGRRLQVHYQPKVDPRSGRAVGAEALVRWRDPVHGDVSPDEFIPLAEQAGLVQPLTAFVLEVALADCAAWRRTRPDFLVAVNLSTRSLSEPGLPAEVADALRRAGLPSAALVLEITETTVMTDLRRSLVVLHELRALGVQLSVDDFGTGHSSLAYLKQLPVSEMKVDRSFVLHAATDAGDAAIVRAAIELGHALGLHVVAEGVEDAVTLDVLGSWGCDSVQGFHISRPVPAAAFTQWLATAGSRQPATVGGPSPG